MTEHVPHRRTVVPGSPEAAEMVRLTAVVGERLQRRLAEVTASCTEAIEEGVEDLGDPEMVDMLTASVDGNIATIVHILRNDIPIDHIQPITAATEYAMRLARRGVPAASLRRAYHFGSDDLLAQMFAEVRQLDVDPDVRLRLLHHLAGWTHSYVDWITRIVLDAYEDERQQVEARSATVAASQVRAVLEGVPGSGSGFFERTGYRLDRHHLAAVLWIAGANAGVDQTEGLRSLALELRTAVGAVDAPLFTAVDRSTAWVWFGLGVSAAKAAEHTLDHEAVDKVMARHEGARVAFGRLCPGADGFRRSHRQAGAARNVGSVARDGRQTFAHSDRAVAMIAMMLHDPDALSAWVQDVLGPLAARTEAAARLRETVLIYLTCGGSIQDASERLTLHRNTVKYRLGRALELRGRALEDDRLGVEVALEVVRLLGDSVLE
jgi:hypothetical protein